MRQGRLDAVELPVAPLDILAQQIVAVAACEDWDEDELLAMCRRAWPYRDLKREDFDAVVQMLSEGVAPGHRTAAYLHRERIHHKLRARRSAHAEGAWVREAALAYAEKRQRRAAAASLAAA